VSEPTYRDGLTVVNPDGTDTGGPLQFLADALLMNGVDRQAAAMIVSTIASALEVERKAADMDAWRQAETWRDELAAKISRSEQLYGVQMEAAWEMHDVIAAVRARGMRDGLAVAAAILAESRTQ
jgi:hypothetical protein